MIWLFKPCSNCNMNKVSWGPVSTFPQSTSDLTIQRRDGNENVKIQYKYFTGASHFLPFLHDYLVYLSVSMTKNKNRNKKVILLLGNSWNGPSSTGSVRPKLLLETLCGIHHLFSKKTFSPFALSTVKTCDILLLESQIKGVNKGRGHSRCPFYRGVR